MKTVRTRYREPSWHAIQMMLGFMAAFVVGDWIVGWVEVPRHYTGRNIVRDKLALYENEQQAPDVVFLGTSHEWCGIDPATIDKTARQSSGDCVRSLNLASSSASTITNYLLARRIVESARHPKLVYLGVSPAATDANETDTMLNGLRALGEFRDLPLAWSCDPDLFWDTLATSLLGSYYQWDDIRTLGRRVVMGAPTTPHSRMEHTKRGWARWRGSSARLPRHEPPLVDRETLSRRTTGYSQRGPLAGALYDTIELLTSVGIEVRLLEIPVATIAAPWSRPESNAPYRAMIDRVARVSHTRIVRSPRGLLQDSDFFDPVHLHAHGARKLSKWLAADVTAALRNSRPAPVRSYARS